MLSSPLTFTRLTSMVLMYVTPSLCGPSGEGCAGASVVAKIRFWWSMISHRSCASKRLYSCPSRRTLASTGAMHESPRQRLEVTVDPVVERVESFPDGTGCATVA
jgi:hypothetical protein